MSIASELTNLEGNIGDAYDAVSDMSGIIPQHKNMANLDQAIRTIPQNSGITATTFHWGGSPTYSMYKDSGYTTAATYSDIATAFANGLVYIADGEDEVTYVVVSDIPDAYTITVTGIGLPDHEGGSTSYAYASSTWTKTATEFQKKLTAGSNVQINGTTISATDTTYSDFTGATSLDAGSHGLVPAPVAGDQGKVLTGGGSWTDIFNLIYPVGSIYMSVNNTDPGTLFGGTWTQIQDSFILAAGSTYTGGSTGGAATINLAHSHTVNSHNHSLPANTGSHTLTINEIPSHSHNYPLLDIGDTSTPKSNGIAWQRRTYWNYADSSSVGGGKGHTHSIGGNTGDKSPGTNSQLSSTQSILPPYLAVYVWKRTA